MRAAGTNTEDSAIQSIYAALVHYRDESVAGYEPFVSDMVTYRRSRAWLRFGLHGCLILGLVVLPRLAPEARADWRTVATDQGIEVFERPVEGRDLPMFRGIGEVRAGVEEILSVLSDVSQHTRWMPDCAEARVLREEGDYTYVYRRSSAPWPVSDRDVVIRSRTEVIEPGLEVHVYFEGVDDPSRPPDSGTVRMPHLAGHYKIRARGPERTRVEYQLDVDPGGRLPGWMAARASRTNPVRTLVGLRRQLAERRVPAVGTGEP